MNKSLSKLLLFYLDCIVVSRGNFVNLFKISLNLLKFYTMLLSNILKGKILDSNLNCF